MGNTVPQAVPKRDWKKYVEDSKGESVMVPEEFIEATKKWSDDRVEFNKKIEELGKLEAQLSNTFLNLIFNLKQRFSDGGRDDVWTKDVGIDMDALKDGVYIINIVESPSNPMRG